jgi:hypothetical protein
VLGNDLRVARVSLDGEDHHLDGLARRVVGQVDLASIQAGQQALVCAGFSLSLLRVRQLLGLEQVAVHAL